MSTHAPTIFDLSAIPFQLGEENRSYVDIYLPPLHLAGQDYRFVPDVVPAELSVTYTGEGYAAVLSFSCRLEGACWRCLEPADVDLDIRVRDYFETELPPIEEMGEEEEATLWYTEDGLLDLSAWAHDAVAEALPTKILCRPDCKGLCAQCGANLNVTECGCEVPADSRWDKLKEWKGEQD